MSEYQSRPTARVHAHPTGGGIHLQLRLKTAPEADSEGTDRSGRSGRTGRVGHSGRDVGPIDGPDAA